MMPLSKLRRDSCLTEPEVRVELPYQSVGCFLELPVSCTYAFCDFVDMTQSPIRKNSCIYVSQRLGLIFGHTLSAIFQSIFLDFGYSIE
jgi:hypothetical protein